MPRCRPLAPRNGIACVALFATVACVSVRPVVSDGAFVLEDDEGILVVEIETDVPVASLRLRGVPVVEGLQSGEHLVLVAIGAGDYAWSDLRVPSTLGQEVRLRLRHDDLAFRVRAGRINYAGCLVLRGRTAPHFVSLRFRVENRSAQVAALLGERHPELVRRHPPLFSGPYRDDFLERFGTPDAASLDRTEAAP